MRWTRQRRRKVEIAGRVCPVSDIPRAGRTAPKPDKASFGEGGLLRTAKACGPGTRGWCQIGGGFRRSNRVRKTVNSPMTEAKGIRLRGERGISRQTIAQGRPDALRWTCMLVCVFLRSLHTRPRVPASTRPSLRPLILWGRKFLANLGRIVSRDREVMFAMTTGREAFSLTPPGEGERALTTPAHSKTQTSSPAACSHPRSASA